MASKDGVPAAKVAKVFLWAWFVTAGGVGGSQSDKPVLTSSVSKTRSMVLVQAICWLMKVRPILIRVGILGNLGLNMIRNLLNLALSAVVYRPSLPIMILAMSVPRVFKCCLWGLCGVLKGIGIVAFASGDWLIPRPLQIFNGVPRFVSECVDVYRIRFVR